MATLTKAHTEWSKRPADERFSSVQDMHDRALYIRYASRTTSPTAINKLRAIVDGDNVRLQGSSGATVAFNHWSFGQLATRAEAPASYVRNLPAELSAACLNDGLARAEGDGQLLINSDTMTARAITSPKYSRIWNSEITSRLLDLEASGPWQPAPAAFDGSRGLYLGDRDMFAFMVDNERRIFESLPGGGLGRGFFLWNSEVGAASVGVCTFLYEYVCGNHRVWGASEVKELRIRHVGGDLDNRAFGKFRAELTEYANSSAADDELRIQRMRDKTIGATKQDVIDAIFSRFPKLGKRTTIAAADLAEVRADWYGNPRSVWGIAGAITEIARDMPNASDRDELNRIGSKVMMAF